MRHLKFYILVSVFSLLFFQGNNDVSADAGLQDYYSIHNGSYREKKNAEAYIASMEKTGIPAFIEKVDLKNKGIWYRVYIGRYVDSKSAKKAIIDLKKDNIHDLGYIKRFSSKQSQTTVLVKKIPKNVDHDTGVGKEKANKIERIKTKGPQAPSAIPQASTKVTISDRQPPDIVKHIPRTAQLKREEPQKDRKSADKGDLNPVLRTNKGGTETAGLSPGLIIAREAFRSERYSEAVHLLDSFISEGNPDKRMVETAHRMKTESLYRIGIKDDSQTLLKAVDLCKTLIKNYPDPAEGNDLIYFRLAESYEKLSFFYEAATAWEGIVTRYPGSTYFEEALFKSGYVLISTGKEEKVHEKLSRYVNQYPNGIYAKKAYYTLGDILCQMQRLDQAGKWFDLVRRKWPDMSDIPETVLSTMGGYYVKAARYDDAFEVLSFLVNLCPSDDFGKNSLFLLAQTAEKSEDIFLALKLYAFLIEKYPQSKEAEESALAMANLGVERPGIKVAGNIWRMDNYLNPLKTYEKMLEKGEGDLERIMFFKARALTKNGNLAAALSQYVAMSKKYPRGKFHKEVAQNFKTVLAALTDQYYERGDYKAVGALYFKTTGQQVHSPAEDVRTGLKIGRSLQRLGFYKEAAGVFSDCKGEDNGELALSLAELDISMGNANLAEEKLNLLSKKQFHGDYKKMLQTTREKLADLYFMKGDYAKAAVIYQEAIGGDAQKRDAVFYLHYGRSLQAKKMTQEALKHFTAALKSCEAKEGSCKNNVLSGIHMGLGDIFCVLEKFDDGIAMYRQALKYAADEESKKWLMLRIGQAYGGRGDFLRAEKIFSQIKETPNGGFWPELADFFISQYMPPTSMEKVNE